MKTKKHQDKRRYIVTIVLAGLLIAAIAVLLLLCKPRKQHIIYEQHEETSYQMADPLIEQPQPTTKAQEVETGQEQESEEETEPEPAPQDNFGDDGVPFVSDDTHYVYQKEADVYYVFTYSGDQILKYAKYLDCQDKETTKEYLDYLNETGAFAYPEIRDIYAKNHYVITEYSQTKWQGLTADKLDELYGEFKLEADS